MAAAGTSYWADNYVEKKCSVQAAIQRIQAGQRVFVGSSSGEPQHLVREFAESAARLRDVEIVRLLALETTPLTLIANKTKGHSLNIRSFYLGSAKPREVAKNIRFITPMNLSAVPRLFKTRQLPIHVALIQVSPPDDFGWMSLGVSVDITLSAALSADFVIAQVNSKMPRVLGRSFIHVNDVDVFVEYDEELPTIEKPLESEAANIIAKYIPRLIEDGSTLEISLGTTPQAIMQALQTKNDLGIHTQYLTDEILRLVSMGVITNRKKGYNDGKTVASTAIGSQALYEFMDDNPGIEFHPSDYVQNPSIISRHNRMVSINVAMSMDLTGQVAADALPINYFSGVTGMVDFMRGTAMADNGKSFLIMTSTSQNDKKSRVVPMLSDTAVVVPRGDVHYVVTEYGAVNLFGKSIQERALCMISIAHPDFRDELFFEAKKMGLLAPDRILKESLHGIYPVQFEEVLEIDGEPVVFRPVKPVDERRIQEHFYTLDKNDVVARFFHEKSTFFREEVEGLSQIDYVKNLTIVAVIGEFGFGSAIAVGEYLLDEKKDMAEIAFSVSKDWQGKGIGKIILRKLAESAKENKISGLYAYTVPDNAAMIRLFRSLPYEVEEIPENDVILLQCKFDEA